MNILVAVNNLTLRNLLESTIRKHQYTPTLVECGHQAWKILQKTQTPTLAILGEELSGISGMEICDLLQRNANNVCHTLLVVKDYSKLSGQNIKDYIHEDITAVELNFKIRCALNLVSHYQSILRYTAKPSSQFDGKILVVEDDEISRIVVTDLIQQSGYESLEAKNGEQALQFFEKDNFPRFVILDWMIPKISGVDVCKKIRKMQNKAPIYIIFLTAKNAPQDLRDGFDCGADDYLTKPFSANELDARIQVGVRYINTQLSTQKRAQQAEINYKHILQNTSQGIYRATINGELILVNPSFASICGYDSPAEMMKNVQLLQELYVNQQHFFLASKILQQNTSTSIEVELKRQDNTKLWICENLSINNNDDGSQYIDGFVQNISERKQNEIQLQKLNQSLENRIVERTKDVEKARGFYHLILDALPSHIAVLNQQGCITFVNKAWRVFRDNNGLKTLSSSLGKNYISACLHAQGDNKKQLHEIGYKLQQTLDGSLMGFRQEYPCPTPNNIKWFNLEVVRFYFDGEVHVVTAHEDITTLKKIQKESLKSRDEARLANKAKGQFLANMSHEIRTPLNAIIGLNTLLKNTQLTPKQFDYVAKINLASRNLLSIINDILNLSKIESTKIQLESTKFDLDDVFEKITNICILNIEQKQLEFIINVHEDVPTELTGDPVRLGQILTNLINNATKFTEYGEIELLITLCKQNTQDFTLQFTVKDTGIGIPADRCQELFEAFTQVDTSTTRKYGGTGLGLSICKHFVHLMGGTIYVKSKEGYGSAFTFTIPFPHGDKKQKRITNAFKVYNQSTFYILDKNKRVRNILRDYLKNVSSNIRLILSVEEFITQIDTAKNSVNNFLLIQYDTSFPLEYIKKWRRYTKIILLVSYTGTSHRKIKSSVDAILPKPIYPKILYKTLNKIAIRGSSRTSRIEKISRNFKDFKGKRLLLVEDHKINQTVIQELLETQNFKVAIANHGKEALDILTISSEAEFCAILMDLQMPEMGGMEAISIIRQLAHCKEIPIIALTGDVMSSTKQTVLEAGFNDYLTKPIEVDDLFIVLNKWIGATYTREKTPQKNIPILSSLNGIDTEKGLHRVAGNSSLYCKLLKQFAERYTNLNNELQLLLKENQIAQLKNLCHTVKGTAGNLGMDNLYTHINELEKAIHLQDATKVSLLFTSTCSEITKVIETLEVFKDTHSKESTNFSTKIEYDEKNILKELDKLLLNFDIEALSYFEQNENIFANIFRDKVQEFKKYLREYDFEKALHMLVMLKGKNS